MKMLNNSKDIKSWLSEHGIKYYTIHENLSVSVSTNVDLNSKNITHIPLQFNYIEGYFHCSYNQLTTLIGSPNTVRDSFFCNHNELTSLIGAPLSVLGDFNCSYNQLTSLLGAPVRVGKDFFCRNNRIASLEFCPEHIEHHYFNATNNPSLGEFQYTTDFSVIKAEHLRIQAVLRDKAQLDELLEERVDERGRAPTFKL